MGLGFAVPGADLLAYVAAKNPGVQGVGHFTRKRSVQLNGCMADAAAAINDHWSNYGLGRAGVDAARAAPAMVRHGKVRNKIVVHDEFGQKKVGSCVLAQQKGIFAYPAKSAALGPCALHHGSTVYKAATLNGSDRPAEFVQQLVQAFFHDLVVVFSVGVAGNSGMIIALYATGLAEVIKGQAHYGLCPRHQFARVEALVKMVLHVAHASLEP